VNYECAIYAFEVGGKKQATTANSKHKKYFEKTPLCN